MSGARVRSAIAMHSFTLRPVGQPPPFDPLKYDPLAPPPDLERSEREARLTAYWRVAREWVRGGFPLVIHHHSAGDLEPELAELGSHFTSNKIKDRRVDNEALTYPLDVPERFRPHAKRDEARAHSKICDAFDLAVYQTATNLSIPLDFSERPYLHRWWPKPKEMALIDFTFMELFEDAIHTQGRKLKSIRRIMDTLHCGNQEATELYREGLQRFAILANPTKEEVQAITESIALEHAVTSDNPVPAIKAAQASRGIGKDANKQDLSAADMLSIMFQQAKLTNEPKTIDIELEEEK